MELRIPSPERQITDKGWRVGEYWGVSLVGGIDLEGSRWKKEEGKAALNMYVCVCWGGWPPGHHAHPFHAKGER